MTDYSLHNPLSLLDSLLGEPAREDILPLLRLAVGQEPKRRAVLAKAMVQTLLLVPPVIRIIYFQVSRGGMKVQLVWRKWTGRAQR